MKAIHGYIFQDVYEWAGHARNESPIVDGARVEPIGGLAKGGTSFLHGSRIEFGLDEALKPIRDPEVLRGSTPEQFAERAGQVLAELNYVHPFREGNGRAQEAFIVELGRHYGHDFDFTVISKPRMIEASIETTNDPSSPAMKHVMEDATNPNRQEAIRSAFADLEECGEQPLQHNVRTARAGEEITGTVLGHDNRVASLVTEQGVVSPIAWICRRGCPTITTSPLRHDRTFPAWGASSRPPRRNRSQNGPSSHGRIPAPS